MTEDQREGFDDLLQAFNYAMMEVDPEEVHLEAPAAVQVAFDKYQAALRRQVA